MATLTELELEQLQAIIKQKERQSSPLASHGKLELTPANNSAEQVATLQQLKQQQLILQGAKCSLCNDARHSGPCMKPQQK